MAWGTVQVAVLFLVLPLVVAVCMAFDSRQYLGPFPPPAISFQWFHRFFTDEFVRRALRTSIALAVLTTAISTVIGTTAAVALHRYAFPGKGLLASFFVSPMIIPAVVIGFAILLAFSMLGLQNGFARLVAGHVIITLPYVIRATLASLAGIKGSLVEAAMVLGANQRRAFLDVTLPLARAGIIAGMIFTFAISVDDVAVSIFLTDANNVTLPVALISMMRSNLDLTIAAGAVLLVMFTLLVVIILDRLFGIDRVVGARSN
jgi:putative spermidine/putrescine transport system permease protein